MTKTIEAHEVGEGNFLPGLDNGYVVEVERVDGITLQDHRYAVWHSGDFMKFTFHTAEGEEAYLTCPADMPITVE